MLPQSLLTMLMNASAENVEGFLSDESCVFMVDWREDDDAIVRYCEDVLHTGELSAEMIYPKDRRPEELFVTYRGQRHQVPLENGPGDRHITLLTLNQILAPDVEIRWCIVTAGDDTLACVPLPIDDWRTLENRFGEEVGKHFGKIQARPNLFTDSLGEFVNRE